MLQTIQEIINQAKSLGYTIHTKPFKLNIIGVRSANRTDQSKFDDKIAYFTYDNNGKLIGKIAPATTDPSTAWLTSPMESVKSKGTAILKSGEYKDAYKIDLHKKEYEAVVQYKPVTVIRDNDRNALINYLSKTEKGIFGINIHKASLGKNNEYLIGKDSAGCQVFQKVADFNDFMFMAHKSKDLHGNVFSYILLDEIDKVKFVNTGILGLGLILLTISIYRLFYIN
jgi:hypothetical protein